MMHDFNWSIAEKKIARDIFDVTYSRECADLIKRIQAKAAKLSDPEDIWSLHDFITKQIRAIGKKYDYRYSVLLLVFAQLIKDGWLTIDELRGFSEDKIDRINTFLNL
jgi:hypothetical protein